MRRTVLLLMALLLTCGLACAEGAAGPDVPEAGVYTRIDQLEGKPIGSATGTTFDQIVRGWLPDAKCSYYNTLPDMVKALESSKIEAFACEEPVRLPIMAENSRVTMLPQYLDTFEFGFIFGKDARGATLSAQMSELIGDLRKSGELSALNDKWLAGSMGDAAIPDIRALSGENGRLRFATSGIALAVLGFTLTFGASVFGLLRLGVGAVEDGQYETAYALGYSNRRTFFKIILPRRCPTCCPPTGARSWASSRPRRWWATSPCRI